jgi:preprotein translocase SecF subunit
MKYRRLSYVVSAVLIALSIFSISTKGLNYGIDFAGGIVMEVRSRSNDLGITEMRSALSAFRPEMQEDGGGNVMIRLGLTADSTEEEQNTIVREIREILGDRVTYEQMQIVGPKIGAELIRGGIMAVIFAFFMMALYIWVRYKGGFAIGALVSLFHDFILMFGFFSITGLEFSQVAIAVILTGIGYSINDKVVNYDRIQENAKKYAKMPKDELIDLSVNEMLTRTILTSSSTLLVMVALWFLAGPILGEFAIAMMFSIFMGAFSSIFISNSLLLNFEIRDN